MLALLGDAERGGAVLALNSPLCAAARSSATASCWRSAAMRTTRCAARDDGHQLRRPAAPRASPPPAGLPPDKCRPALCQGQLLFAGRPRALLAPDLSGARAGGLGVHLTLDLGGQARFGPDVEWIEAIDYTVDPGAPTLLRRGPPLLAATGRRRAAAGLCRHPAQARTRRARRLRFPGFRPRRPRLPGLINLFGIESPGLTASLALAEHVAQRLDG
jgi:hypothetical protein